MHACMCVCVCVCEVKGGGRLAKLVVGQDIHTAGRGRPMR